MAKTTIQKKVCILGDFSVGKTSLARRFVYDRFEDKYLSTIGVKVSRKTIVVPFDNNIADMSILLWDIAGSEEFNQLRLSYIRGSAGAVMVCDLTRPETFEHLPLYLRDLQQVSPTAQIILAANKSDLPDQQLVTIQQIEDYACSLNVPYFVTSAKSGNHVETLFRRLGQLMVQSN